GQGRRDQLAAGPEWPGLRRHATLLAEGIRTGRNVETAGRAEDQMRGPAASRMTTPGSAQRRLSMQPRHGELSMITPQRAVLAGGSFLTSAAFVRNIPTAAAQPVEAGGAPEPARGPLET